MRQPAGLRWLDILTSLMQSSQEGCVLIAGVVIILCYENLLCRRLDKAKYMLVLGAVHAEWRLPRVPRSSSWSSCHQWRWPPSTCSMPPWPGKGEKQWETQCDSSFTVTIASCNTWWLPLFNDWLAEASQPHPAYSYPACSGSVNPTSAFSVVGELCRELWIPYVGICGCFDLPVGINFLRES